MHVGTRMSGQRVGGSRFNRTCVHVFAVHTLQCSASSTYILYIYRKRERERMCDCELKKAPLTRRKGFGSRNTIEDPRPFPCQALLSKYNRTRVHERCLGYGSLPIKLCQSFHKLYGQKILTCFRIENEDDDANHYNNQVNSERI